MQTNHDIIFIVNNGGAVFVGWGPRKSRRRGAAEFFWDSHLHYRPWHYQKFRNF